MPGGGGFLSMIGGLNWDWDKFRIRHATCKPREGTSALTRRLCNQGEKDDTQDENMVATLHAKLYNIADYNREHKFLYKLTLIIAYNYITAHD